MLSAPASALPPAAGGRDTRRPLFDENQKEKDKKPLKSCQGCGRGAALPGRHLLPTALDVGRVLERRRRAGGGEGGSFLPLLLGASNHNPKITSMHV